MNNLTQMQNYLFGNEKALNDLKEKQSAKILVLSDIHGEKSVFLEILKQFGSEVDALVFCGDGTDDFCSYINASMFDIKMKDIMPPVVAIVHGNCDYDDYALENGTVINNPFFVTFEAAGKHIFVTHGHNYAVYRNSDTIVNAAMDYHADFIFYGHTHCAKAEDVNGTLVLNPGSIALPRGSNIPSFAIVSFPGNVERYEFQFYGIQNSVFKKNQFFPINF